jgi:hypothetical protein
MTKLVLAVLAGFLLLMVSISVIPKTGAYFERSVNLPGTISVQVPQSALFILSIDGSGFGNGSGPSFHVNITDPDYKFSNSGDRFVIGTISNNSSHNITIVNCTVSGGLSDIRNRQRIVFSVTPTEVNAGATNVVFTLVINVHHVHTTARGLHSGEVHLTFRMNGVDYLLSFPLEVYIRF